MNFRMRHEMILLNGGGSNSERLNNKTRFIRVEIIENSSAHFMRTDSKIKLEK